MLSQTYDSSAHLDCNALQQVVMQLVHRALHICQARAENRDTTLGVAVQIFLEQLHPLLCFVWVLEFLKHGSMY